ncbi:exonuclease domain-containing protein [Massilia sp.]|uniref:exonuclease domain-containing protein n=1 Tax=Massilia sp. TaxID=1882437 RepID=UPI00352E3E76
MNSLLAFDYATTGSDPVRNRPTEFACVCLDMDLNIIGNPTSSHCIPSPDHLPDPTACLLNGITPQFCGGGRTSRAGFRDRSPSSARHARYHQFWLQLEFLRR